MNVTELITLAQAANLLPGKPHPSCVWRWARDGVKSRSGERVRLEHVRAGGRLFTSKAALETFLARVAEGDVQHFDERAASDSAARLAPEPIKPTSARRRHQLEEADRELRDAGILT